MTHQTSGRTMRGVAPLIIILAIVVIGGGVLAVMNRDVLKTYFETGDVPTQEQFGDTIDSSVHSQDDGVPEGKDYNPTKNYGVGDTVVRNQVIFQAKALSTLQETFTLKEPQDITFRWTPVVPKPQEPVTYRLKVWQLMQGQSGASAMKENKPVATKEVSGASEVTVSGLYTGPCRPPYLCDFVWSVEAESSAALDAGGGSAPSAGAAH